MSTDNKTPSPEVQDGEHYNNRAGNMRKRWGVPPFSILNARETPWQERKKAWLAFGIQSELGRGNDVLGEGDEERKSAGVVFDDVIVQDMGFYRKKAALEKKMGRVLSKQEYMDNYYEPDEDTPFANGASIFDPVVCETLYRWFAPKDGTILDPFAGGSVRGIVAGKMGFKYVGQDLRAEQIDANVKQGLELIDESKGDVMPKWIAGDSLTITDTCKGVEADLLFSCPPYADLEVYSDDPSDLSNMPYDKFVEIYRQIIAKSCSLLKDDSFACFIVGEVRTPKGPYLNFVGDTVKAFMDAGMSYYDEVILATMVGSLPIRAGKPFEVSRKIGKSHQNILIFVKGDAYKAAAKINVGMDDVIERLEMVMGPAYRKLKNKGEMRAVQESIMDIFG
jgi:DNA modification methylase